MKRDYYIDAVMGDWKHNKKKSTKENICYTREATVKLHKDYAVVYTDPEDFNDYKVHGEVVLTEEKLLEVATSAQNYFRGVRLTPKSIKEAVIK